MPQADGHTVCKWHAEETQPHFLDILSSASLAATARVRALRACTPDTEKHAPPGYAAPGGGLRRDGRAAYAAQVVREGIPLQASLWNEPIARQFRTTCGLTSWFPTAQTSTWAAAGYPRLMLASAVRFERAAAASSRYAASLGCRPT